MRLLSTKAPLWLSLIIVVAVSLSASYTSYRYQKSVDEKYDARTDRLKQDTKEKAYRLLCRELGEKRGYYNDSMAERYKLRGQERINVYRDRYAYNYTLGTCLYSSGVSIGGSQNPEKIERWVIDIISGEKILEYEAEIKDPFYESMPRAEYEHQEDELVPPIVSASTPL